MKIRSSILLAVLFCLLLTTIVSGDTVELLRSMSKEQASTEDVIALFSLDNGDAAYLTYDREYYHQMTLAIVHPDGSDSDNFYYEYLIDNEIPSKILISACGQDIHAVVHWGSLNRRLQYFNWKIDAQVRTCKDYTVYIPSIIENANSSYPVE